MQFLLKINKPCNKYFSKQTFTISSVQDACLEHAEVLGALQKFEKTNSPPFPISKIFKSPYNPKTVIKSASNIFKIITKNKLDIK
jgi:hypothetical protein